MNVLAFDTCLGAVSAGGLPRGCSADGAGVREAYEARTTRPRRAADAVIAEVMAARGARTSPISTASPSPSAPAASPACASALRRRAPWRWRRASRWSASPAWRSWRIEAGELLGVKARRRLLAVAVDARRGMVYLQLFEAGGATSAPHAAGARRGGRHDRYAHRSCIVGSGAAAVAVAARRPAGRPRLR